MRSNQASPVIQRFPSETRRISWSLQASGTWNSNLKSRYSLAPKKRSLSPSSSGCDSKQRMTHLRSPLWVSRLSVWTLPLSR